MHIRNRFGLVVGTLALVASSLVFSAVTGRYIWFGNALSEQMELREFEVYSGGKNVILGHPDVFTHGLEYSWYMLKRDPEQLAQATKMLVDGDLKVSQRVSFGSKVGGGYLDIALYNTSLELDLGSAIPIDRIAIYRSRFTGKVHADQGWRVLVVLDEQRRIVSWEAFNVYESGWNREESNGCFAFDMQAAEGAPAGRVVPEGARSWLSEVEYIRDFLGKPVVDLVKEMTPEAEMRLERFQHRNDPDQIEKLGKVFFRLVDLDSPGLEETRERVHAGDYAGALTAFKKPFLSRLAPFADWNAGEGTSIYTHYSWMIEPDTRNTTRSRDLRNHLQADRNDFAVKRFIPGLLPPGPLTFPFQMRPLLLNYVVSNDVGDLRLWEAMTDDWAMGFQDAADKDPQKLRGYFILLQNLMGNLKDLYMAAQTAPRFAEEVSGATLARFLMPILEEIPVANWRVTRTGTFNHTYNGIPEGIFVSRMLDEFYAGQRWAREMQQSFERLYTLNQYRDGSMAEIGDEGHYLASVISPANWYGTCARGDRPIWFTPALETYFLDNYRANILSHVRNISPCGAHVRWNANVDRLLFLEYELGLKDPYWRNVTDMRMQWGDFYPNLTLPVLLEREPRAIIDTVYGRGRPEPENQGKKSDLEGISVIYRDGYQGRPSFVSDWLPYAGLWYFRGGWGHEDSFLHMIKPAIATNIAKGWDQLTQRYANLSDFLSPTSYRFYDYATPLFTGVGVCIDDQPPCPEEKRVPCGSKQGNFNRAVEKPQPSRWYTDRELDFGEALYQGNYRIARMEFDHKKREHFFRRSPNPVNGVTTTRQIFQVRSARLFLQVDRVRYADPDETHTNTLKNTMVLTADATGKTPATEDRIQIVESPYCLEMAPPDNAGITIAWFGQDELDLSLEKRDLRHPDGHKLGGPSITLNGYRRTRGQDVLASWTGTGETVLMSLIRAYRPGEDPIHEMVDLSTDSVAGVQATMSNGTTVSLLVARRPPEQLSVSGAKINGEALLLVEQPGKRSYGLALGAMEGSMGVEKHDLCPTDFRFELKGKKLLGVLSLGDHLKKTPVRRPIDPPTIGPAVNTFSDITNVVITSATPDVDIYYIAESMEDSVSGGSAVGTARASVNAGRWRRYKHPFSISESTFVRARAFRKSVMSVPFESDGTTVSAISYGFFHKREPLPALTDLPVKLTEGLDYDYLEDRWFALWTYTDQLEAKKTGRTDRLLDVSMRETDGPFGVRYNGYIDIPEDGVYTFYAPEEYVNHTCAPGYDLRVFIDGEEWYLGQTWHGLGRWSIPLEAGLHRFRVTFADARAKDLENQRVDLAFHYPYPQTTWRGTAPTLEISGPHLDRQPLPNSWLKH